MSNQDERKNGSPIAAAAYIWTLVVAGGAVLGLSLSRLLPLEGATLWLIGLTVVASCFPLRIPIRLGTRQVVALSAGEFFIFAALVLASPAAAVCAAALEGLTASIRSHVKSPTKYFFNVAQNSAATFCAGWTFDSLASGADAPGPLQTAAGLLAAAFVYFLVNTFAVATVVGLSGGPSIAAIWKRYCFWAGPGILINAAAALVAVHCFSSPGAAATLLFGLLAALFVAIGVANSRKLLGERA